MKLLLPLGLLLLASCGKNMVQQDRYDEYEASSFLPDGMAMQHPPEGTVSRDVPERAATQQRPAMTLALVERGRERYEIFCAPCHGRDGRGHGMIPSRGFPQPPDYHSDRLKAAPPEHFYDVITNGYGVMFSYADRVPPRDRWAIVAYIRALQRDTPRSEARNVD